MEKKVSAFKLVSSQVWSGSCCRLKLASATGKLETKLACICTARKEVKSFHIFVVHAAGHRQQGRAGCDYSLGEPHVLQPYCALASGWRQTQC